MVSEEIVEQCKCNVAYFFRWEEEKRMIALSGPVWSIRVPSSLLHTCAGLRASSSCTISR